LSGELDSRPALFYIFKPAIQRFEISRYLAGQAESYKFSEITGREIRVEKSGYFDSLRVVMNYGRNVPSNFGAIFNLPLVELYIDGILKMFAQETFFSSLIPGYTNLILYNDAGVDIGRVYDSKGELYISLEGELSEDVRKQESIERDILWLLCMLKN
jgi:hypothetical protein